MNNYPKLEDTRKELEKIAEWDLYTNTEDKLYVKDFLVKKWYVIRKWGSYVLSTEWELLKENLDSSLWQLEYRLEARKIAIPIIISLIAIIISIISLLFDKAKVIFIIK